MTPTAYDDALEVHLSPGAHPLLSGRWGAALLLGPGVVMTLVGVVMSALYGRSAGTLFFGAIIIISGLFAIHSGRGMRQLAVANRENPPVAFTLHPEGVEVGGRLLGWDEASFRVDDAVDPPTVVCGATKSAWPATRLDTSVDVIKAALDLRRS